MGQGQSPDSLSVITADTDMTARRPAFQPDYPYSPARNGQHFHQIFLFIIFTRFKCG